MIAVIAARPSDGPGKAQMTKLRQSQVSKPATSQGVAGRSGGAGGPVKWPYVAMSRDIYRARRMTGGRVEMARLSEPPERSLGLITAHYAFLRLSIGGRKKRRGGEFGKPQASRLLAWARSARLCSLLLAWRVGVFQASRPRPRISSAPCVTQ